LKEFNHPDVKPGRKRIMKEKKRKDFLTGLAGKNRIKI
jgi:hypothetical protein